MIISMLHLSVIIPTIQAGKLLPDLLANLQNQSVPPEDIVIVDSSSDDDTFSIAQANNCTIKVIDRSLFRHGRSRNLGASMARGDAFVFLTQDVLPANRFFLEYLSKPLLQGLAVAAHARQVAFPSANPIESYARSFNYPEQSYQRTSADLPKMGIKTYFFSNSASIIRRDAFLQIGGFSEKVIVNEDMHLCANLIHNGYTVAYQSEAIVYHSHNYRLNQLFKRYFDIGVFFSQASNLIRDIQPDREGLRLILEQIRALKNIHAYSWIPRVFLETFVKYTAFQIGKRQRYLPRALKTRLSGQAYYW
jgi:rhamnosyltransferase